MFRGIRQFVIPVRDQNFAIMALMVVAGMAFSCWALRASLRLLPG